MSSPAREKKPVNPDDIRAHAERLMSMPAGEQWIGHMQVVIAAALNDIARYLEELPPSPQGAQR
jgi:hypothetical protein